MRENGLKVSGKKQELVERVLPLLKEAKDASNLNVSTSSNKSFDNLELTDKAHEFLKENEWIDLYMFALVQFRFEDYETYVEGSSAGMIETGLNFCDEIISRALVNNQFEVFRIFADAMLKDRAVSNSRGLIQEINFYQGMKPLIDKAAEKGILTRMENVQRVKNKIGIKRRIKGMYRRIIK